MTQPDPTTTAIRTLRALILAAGGAHWSKPIPVKHLRQVYLVLLELQAERDRLKAELEKVREDCRECEEALEYFKSGEQAETIMEITRIMREQAAELEGLRQLTVRADY